MEMAVLFGRRRWLIKAANLSATRCLVMNPIRFRNPHGLNTSSTQGSRMIFILMLISFSPTLPARFPRSCQIQIGGIFPYEIGFFAGLFRANAGTFGRLVALGCYPGRADGLNSYTWKRHSNNSLAYSSFLSWPAGWNSELYKQAS